eukprot:gene12372-6040_t
MKEVKYSLLEGNYSNMNSGTNICKCLTLLATVLFAFFCVISIILVFEKIPAPIISYSNNTKVIRFDNFTVLYDVSLNKAVNSTQFRCRLNNPTDRGSWRSNISIFNQKDFSNLTYNGEKLDNYHLTTYLEESMVIVNSVSQYSCHNRGIWRQFESYVQKNYCNEIISTFPIYNETQFLLTPKGKLFVPIKLCKVLRGLSYCIVVCMLVCIHTEYANMSKKEIE